MNLTVCPAEDHLMIRVDECRLDAAIATRFKDQMRDIVGKVRQSVVVDLGPVDFMDSSGLGAMIAIHKAMLPGARLTLRGLRPNVERVFRLTRMDMVFAIEPAATEMQEKLA